MRSGGRTWRRRLRARLQHEPNKPRPWLFEVAANLARDEARTVIRRKKHLALLAGEAERRIVGERPGDGDGRA